MLVDPSTKDETCHNTVYANDIIDLDMNTELGNNKIKNPGWSFPYFKNIFCTAAAALCATLNWNEH